MSFLFRSFGALAICFGVLLATNGPAIAQSALLARLNKLESEVASLRAQLARQNSRRGNKIHDRSTSNQINPKISAPASSAAASESGRSTSRFNGTYISGHLGLVGSLKNNVTSGVNDPSYDFSPKFNLDYSSLRGMSAGLSIGHNFISGNFLFGLEFAGQGLINSSDSQKIDLIGAYAEPLYRCGRSLVLNGCMWVPGTRIADKATINQTASVEAVARGGVILGNTLAYSRIGIGVSPFSMVGRRTTIVTTCTDFIGGTCLGTSNESSVAKQSKQAWLPYFVLGIGLEKNINRYFLRAEANVRYLVPATNNLGIRDQFIQYEVRLGGGLRF